MYELKVTVSKVMGRCTAEPPMKTGDYFCVRDGDISMPGGGYICLWALQSILPLITPKEREIAEARDEDWMWRVHHAQCPDPNGRVIFRLERESKIGKETNERGRTVARRVGTQVENRGGERSGDNHSEGTARGLRDLRVVVQEIKGKCSSGMRPGDQFVLRSGRLYIPADRHFCLYALHAVLPLLPAKQRALEDWDWLKEDSHAICPDPAGNVVMRIESI